VYRKPTKSAIVLASAVRLRSMEFCVASPLQTGLVNCNRVLSRFSEDLPIFGAAKLAHEIMPPSAMPQVSSVNGISSEL